MSAGRCYFFNFSKPALRQRKGEPQLTWWYEQANISNRLVCWGGSSVTMICVGSTSDVLIEERCLVGRLEAQVLLCIEGMPWAVECISFSAKDKASPGSQLTAISILQVQLFLPFRYTLIILIYMLAARQLSSPDCCIWNCSAPSGDVYKSPSFSNMYSKYANDTCYNAPTQN